jgi:outer membrane beta-barrel protein
MESRFQRLFLNFCAFSMLLALSSFLWAQEPADVTNEIANEDELEKIVTPDIQRRTIKESDLDSEDFEVGLFFGLLSIEDFGTNEVQGVTFSYHITENIFTEGTLGLSLLQKTSYELLSGGVQLLTTEQRNLNYYNLSLGYNLLPGEVYLTEKLHFHANIYLIAGVGNTHFAGKDYFTYSLGAGLRFFSTDWLSMDLSMRNYAFTHEIFGETKDTNNLEGRLGLSIYF